MSVEIVPVESTRQLNHFVGLPWNLPTLRNHPVWVPPLRRAVKGALDTRRNPFYRSADRALFLALRGGQPVGRIAAIENRAHNEFHTDEMGFFGFFECADDPEAASALFRSAEGWLRSRGLTRVRGPVSPSINYEVGVLVEGFDQHPFFLTAWNPPYYPDLISAQGFIKAKDLEAYLIPFPEDAAPPERFRRHVERARKRGRVTFREINLSRFAEDVHTCWTLYQAAWKGNWGFSPISYEEFLHAARELKPLLHPHFSYIAEADGVPAGFMLLTLDYNRTFKKIGNGRLFPFGFLRILADRRRLKTGRILTLGVGTEFRSRGILPILMYEAYHRGVLYNGKEAEASWILEDNHLMIQPLVALGATCTRRWRIYEKSL